MMELNLVGLNHKTAPIDLREEIAFAETALPAHSRFCKANSALEKP